MAQSIDRKDCMTVGELLTHLSTLDPNLPVSICDLEVEGVPHKLTSATVHKAGFLVLDANRSFGPLFEGQVDTEDLDC